MLRQTSDFRRIKEEEGGERAVEAFMEKIQEADARAGTTDADDEGPGEGGGGRETADGSAGEESDSAPGGSGGAWQ